MPRSAAELQTHLEQLAELARKDLDVLDTLAEHWSLDVDALRDEITRAGAARSDVVRNTRYARQYVAQLGVDRRNLTTVIEALRARLTVLAGLVEEARLSHR